MKTIVKVYLKDEHGNKDWFVTPINLPEQEAHENYMNVNIYVKDNIRNGEAEMNDARCRELCKVAIQVLETGHGESYRFTLNKQRVLEVNGKNEHFINNKLLYSFNNE